MNSVDYARIHLEVAIRLWKGAPKWHVIFPTYSHYCELRVDAASLAYDAAVAEHYAGRAPKLAARMAGVAW